VSAALAGDAPIGRLDPTRAAPQLRILLSDHGVSIEKIADLVGHSGTTVTEKVYRHHRPMIA